MSKSLIEINGLIKRFPMGNREFTALDGVDLKIEQGEFSGLVGPSGSGKTTILNIVGSLDIPSEGKVEVLGNDIATLTPKTAAKLRNKHIGFIFQTYNLLPVYTVYE
ncbi:MAG: ATP-binding cassette domain-containing protein, partial [Candidatus Marinimicrobia bacterium]|nr:ATP-binding cassette domain-containing protein [Candidatus Neomarinimicrobiota bacterium]